MNIYKITCKSFVPEYDRVYYISTSSLPADECGQLIKAAKNILERETFDKNATAVINSFNIEYIGTLHNYEQEIQNCNPKPEDAK